MKANNNLIGQPLAVREDIDIADLEETCFIAKVDSAAYSDISQDAAVIKIVGVIDQYDTIHKVLDIVEADPSITSVILDLDSPGGALKGCQRTARRINKYTKPITAYISGEACSAAYWLAAACKGGIIAEPTAIVGSIGVIATIAEMKEDTLPVKLTKVISSQTPYKTMSPSTDEGKELLQELVDMQAEIFISDVAKYRNTIIANVIENYGAGKTFIASRALERGMIDSIEGDNTMPIDEEKDLPKDEEVIPSEKEEALPESKEVDDEPKEDEKEVDEKDEEIKALKAELAALKQKLLDDEDKEDKKDEDIEELKAQNYILERTAVIEPLIAKGLISPAERERAELAYDAEANTPGLKVFSEFFANRKETVVALGTRVSHPNTSVDMPVFRTQEEKIDFMARDYCHKNGLDASKNYYQAVLAVTAQLKK
jgi:signal peptide peptidase SppA